MEVSSLPLAIPSRQQSKADDRSGLDPAGAVGDLGAMEPVAGRLRPPDQVALVTWLGGGLHLPQADLLIEAVTIPTS